MDMVGEVREGQILELSSFSQALHQLSLGGKG